MRGCLHHLSLRNSRPFLLLTQFPRLTLSLTRPHPFWLGTYKTIFPKSKENDFSSRSGLNRWRLQTGDTGGLQVAVTNSVLGWTEFFLRYKPKDGSNHSRIPGLSSSPGLYVSKQTGKRWNNREPDMIKSRVGLKKNWSRPKGPEQTQKTVTDP